MPVRTAVATGVAMGDRLCFIVCPLHKSWESFCS